MKVYIAGSLANKLIPTITEQVQEWDHDAFSEWFTPGPDADVNWRDYELALGNNYRQALRLPSAQNTYQFDKKHIDLSDIMVVVLPCGKSAHLEAGYFVGKGKPVLMYFPDASDPERWDVMYNFVLDHKFGGIVYGKRELQDRLADYAKHLHTRSRTDVQHSPS